MPWYNQWSDSIKKRACRYLLQRYLGQFLEEKLTLDQLTVDLYNGTGSVSGVVLDVQALNELGEQENLPIEFVDGYISEMAVSIPLSQLFTESSYIEVSGLFLTVQPKKRACDGGSMFESMWNSMSNSMQLAAECLQQTADDKEAENANLMEGLELFANAIESVLTRVKIKFVNTVLRLEHLPRQGKNGIAVEIRINNIDYCDEACSDPIFSDANPQTTYQSTFSVKKFHCESINFFTDEFPAACRTFSRSIILKQDVEKSGFQTKSRNEPILFGKLSGRQEIRLKIKQDDTLQGPKVDIELSFGSLTLFLSPRQLHLIVELVHSLGAPHTQDTSNVEPKSLPQKPMNICDYEKVEQELQENISCPPVDNKLKERTHINPGWSSASIDDAEEEFLPMKGNMGVNDSLISEGTMDGSFNSTFTTTTINSKCSVSSLENASSWTHKKRSSKKGISSATDSDFSGEMTGFHIRLASLSAVILHEDVLLFDCDTSCLTSTSVSMLKSFAANFFQSLGLYEIQGYGNKDFNKVKDLLSSSCSRSHLRFIATTITIEGSENGNHCSRSLSMVLTAASFQVTECIYSDKTNDSHCSPQYVELLNFIRSSDDSVKPHFPLTGSPDVRLELRQLKKFRNANQTSYIKADISVTMQQCWTEIDLSIIDRINTIIHPEILCQSTSISKESLNEISSFSKAVENASVVDVKFDFKLSTPFLVIKFRFPIPDLRPVHDIERNPWTKRNVRKDVLYFHLIEPSILTESNNRTYLQSYKIYCSEIITLFQEGNTNTPIAFGRATRDKYGNKPPKIGHCIGLPCISFRVSPKEIMDELEETYDDGANLTHSCFMETSPKQPSPFSFKHVVHGNNQSVGVDNGLAPETYGEELIVPADKQEMTEFTNFATRTARVQVDVSLPFVAVHFPSKHFYEVIYNRLNSDLSLWQSSAQKMRSAGICSNIHIDDYMRHPTFFPAFSLCKSGLLYDSDSDSEEMGPGFTPANDSKKQKNPVTLNGQSKYALNIAVNQGLLNICTNLKDGCSNNVTEHHGELQINVEEANFFMVNYYKGLPQQNYVCLLVNEVCLYHKDVHRYDSHYSSPLFSPISSPSHLSPTIYYQHTSVSSKLSSEHSKDMLRAAIHTEVNENKVKVIRVSCGLQNATLQHKVCLPQYTWLTQLMDFFDVVDYPVRGYDSPQVITELHQHLWDCAVDYRPLYIPLKTVLTVGNLSLSSNIAARTKSSTFRFIAEDANLFISDKVNNHQNAINLRSDYISVIELGLFELSLRLSDNIKCPKIDLKALINVVDIRTCSDSARALAQLIKYFASDGDLNVSESSQNSSQSLAVSNANLEIKSGLSESTVERVNNMMEDAMLDDRNDSNKLDKSNSLSDDAKDADIFCFPDEGTQNDVCVPVDWGGSDMESEHDFCILEHEAGSGIMPKSGMPEVRNLSSSPINVIDNYFNLAIGKADLLLPPKHYPTPVFKYTLQDMTLIWHMYGGSDFCSQKKTEKHVHISQKTESIGATEVRKCYVDTGIDETTSNERIDSPIGKRIFRNNGQVHQKGSVKTVPNKLINWHVKGGLERNNNILMQLQLNKVKFQHEVYPEKSVQASRQVLLIHELEIRDRLSTSNINKFLYQYTSEASPRQSHANMVVIKAVHVRPDPRRNVQETCLKLSLLPLRLNIDQDSLIFLINFFSQLSGAQNEGCDDSCHSGGSLHQVPVMSVDNESSKIYEKQAALLSILDDESSNSEKCNHYSNESSGSSASSPLYIRSFVFSPEVPIRIDYEGKRVDMTHGSLAGLLMGLGQLSCLQLKLKKLSYRHGILGFDKLASFVVSEWVQDIKKNQLPNLIGGVGPMHSLVQLFQGIRDLFWLPIEQYQKDGRIVRGLQKGANSFTTSTAIAALEITARIVQAIQSVAETAFDMLSPGPSARRLHGKKGKRQRHYSQPADIREGIANAYTLVREGLGETAETLVRVASVEAEQKGAVGAVGGVLRQIPPTVVAPIILASAATSNLIGGVRSQLAPDARREETNKWRTEDTY